jgi:hypothetical protein
MSLICLLKPIRNSGQIFVLLGGFDVKQHSPFFPQGAASILVEPIMALYHLKPEKWIFSNP